MTSEQPVSVLFSKIADLALAVGAAPMTRYVGCWEYQINEQWELFMNGHKTPTKTETGLEVPPFSCYLEYNGFPAGIINPYGGMLAAGSMANEDALIEAIEGRIGEAKK